jgi:Fic family protein
VRAFAGDLDDTGERRDLQIKAAAHVRVQPEVDRMALEHRLPEPASVFFIRHLYREFYRSAPEAMLLIRGDGREFKMQPGA